MGDKTAGAWRAWRQALAEIKQADAAAAEEPGGKPVSVRGQHWQAYKSVLADLVWEKAISDDEMIERVGRVRMSASLAALRRPGTPQVWICPRD